MSPGLCSTPRSTPPELKALQDAARARGVDLSVHRVATPSEIAPAIAAARNSGAAALNVLATPLLFDYRRVIFERAQALRLPAMYQWPEIAEEDGLVAYVPRLVEIFRHQLSKQLVKLLRGARPAGLPVEQPTHFELVVNVKTAKALGLNIPQAGLQRADRVTQ